MQCQKCRKWNEKISDWEAQGASKSNKSYYTALIKLVSDSGTTTLSIDWNCKRFRRSWQIFKQTNLVSAYTSKDLGLADLFHQSVACLCCSAVRMRQKNAHSAYNVHLNLFDLKILDVWAIDLEPVLFLRSLSHSSTMYMRDISVYVYIYIYSWAAIALFLLPSFDQLSL